MKITAPPKSSGYAALLKTVRQTLVEGQKRVEEEKVRTYWQTGKLLHEHILQHQNRAEYGAFVVGTLSKDLEISTSVLHRTLRFYKAFPKIVARGPQLGWSHYRILITVPDEKQRLSLADIALRKEWPAEKLRQKIQEEFGGMREGSDYSGDPETRPGIVQSEEPAEYNVKPRLEKLHPKQGRLYTYHLLKTEKIHPGKPELKIDLGFSSFKEASMDGAEGLKAGDVVESEWVKGDTYRLKISEQQNEAALYTYYAEIERVVDGDTVIAIVDLGFGVTTRQYLRLRGIDSPELFTAEGKKAKRFVETQLETVPNIVICSSRSDKYDRFLADVYFETKQGPLFLNQLLLGKGFAVAVRG